MSVRGYRKEIRLVSTDHLTDRIWFRDDEDFKNGMNLVAVLAYALGVEVLAFCLMSNHVHFVLCCSKEEADRFLNEFKRRHALYMHRKYGTIELFKRNGIDNRPIDGNQESLEWAVAYVQMNPVAANICLTPSDYRWGTGNVFFRTVPVKGRRVGELSQRERKRILHTGIDLPENYVVGEDGYILSSSYVNVDLVETIFRTPKRMLFFLQNSSKAKRRLSSETDTPAFRDQVIVAAIPDLCKSLFRKPNMEVMTEAEQGEFFKQLRFRFSSNIDQLARVTGFSYTKVASLLDTV